MKRIWRNKEGVSPVIATILMVAITVVLAAVLYVMVSGYMTGGGGTPLSGSLTYRTSDSTPNSGVAKAEVSVTAPSNGLCSDYGITVTDPWDGSTGKMTYDTGTEEWTDGNITVTITHLVSDATHIQGGDRLVLTNTDDEPVNGYEVIVSVTGYSGTMSFKVPV
ncbi:MAG: archaellin/type IV pilin N-terminal domain-containing protein [Methanobacteriota archaeon]